MTQNNKATKKQLNEMLVYLKEEYGNPKTELQYTTQFQCLVAVVLSAQYTDKMVNKLTQTLFKKYKTVNDFASVSLAEFTQDISCVSFFNNKAKNIIATAQILLKDFSGTLPKTVKELEKLPGVGYKTANVVLGEVYGIWEGIAVDTHVRRFALRFELTKSKNPNIISRDLESLFEKKDWKYINNGLVLYGRYLCTAHPHDCAEHPLTKIFPQANTIWPKSK